MSGSVMVVQARVCVCVCPTAARTTAHFRFNRFRVHGPANTRGRVFSLHFFWGRINGKTVKMGSLA